MGTRFFSTKHRPFHLGPYPLERLKRIDTPPDLVAVPPAPVLDFRRLQTPHSLVNAMGEYQAMMDALRDGMVNPEPADAPTDTDERARHMKAFGYFQDASMIGICRLPDNAVLPKPTRNPDIDRLAEELRTKQTKTLASGIDEIMAGLKDSMADPSSSIDGHSHVIVCLVEHLRAPRPDEPGADWLEDAQDHRAALRATETAVILSNYLHLLGFKAKAHTATSSDLDLNKLAVASGLATVENGVLYAPYIGSGFGLAAVSTDMTMAPDRILAAQSEQSFDAAWWVGKGTVKGALNRDPFRRRNYVDGALPFETLKRVDEPTTFIDEARVARVPKRTDMFARAQFGDLGKKQQAAASGGWYARKSAHSFAQRRIPWCVRVASGWRTGFGRPNFQARPSATLPTSKRQVTSWALMRSGFPAARIGPGTATTQLVPNWSRRMIKPSAMIIDQGYETMEGASGDDWIAVAQSMRAYLRFSLLGGVIAKTDPQPWLFRQSAFCDGWRSVAAPASASFRIGRSQPHRRSDPEPTSWAAFEIRCCDDRHAIGA